MATGEKP
jgi:hypothetical protein